MPSCPRIDASAYPATIAVHYRQHVTTSYDNETRVSLCRHTRMPSCQRIDASAYPATIAAHYRQHVSTSLRHMTMRLACHYARIHERLHVSGSARRLTQRRSLHTIVNASLRHSTLRLADTDTFVSAFRLIGAPNDTPSSAPLQTRRCVIVSYCAFAELSSGSPKQMPSCLQIASSSQCTNRSASGHPITQSPRPSVCMSYYTHARASPYPSAGSSQACVSKITEFPCALANPRLRRVPRGPSTLAPVPAERGTQLARMDSSTCK